LFLPSLYSISIYYISVLLGEAWLDNYINNSSMVKCTDSPARQLFDFTDSYLVGGLEHLDYFSIQLGMSSSQLTNSIIFQRGRAQPPTSNIDSPSSISWGNTPQFHFRILFHYLTSKSAGFYKEHTKISSMMVD
jgi:hypothetical protein